ncbi:MFS transporter [Glycomyces harbinensis]|uniref:MFS transporter, CP family, cyanate transporter n=1 Tax=Glycomyces harbinensis TaxID=58114 RepID=A0A1G6UX01_9ACTN|nr:MFS transporter [Glycomyces harbinensis]SDD45155.1 MFS transporter, CP family, cyanate transporter [Glycomyces harbinensis]
MTTDAARAHGAADESAAPAQRSGPDARHPDEHPAPAPRAELADPPAGSAAAAAGWMLVAGIILAAFNFRTAVTSVGAILAELRTGLGMSETVAGLLTTLPVLAFAGLGAFAPRLARRFGPRPLLTGALLTMSLGLIARAWAPNTAVFLLCSLLALAAGAIGNVAVPVIVKRYFPHRIGVMTTAYSTTLAVGTAVAAATTAPVDHLTGDWRIALAVWALPALIAIVPWLLWRPSAAAAAANPIGRLRGVSRSRLAWMMLVAFGCQSAIAYILMGWTTTILADDGMDAAAAGSMLGLLTIVQIPVSVVVPILTVRWGPRPVFLILMACYPPALAALWIDGGGPLTWTAMVLFGIGTSVFPLILTLFGLRARTPAGTSALSSFAQSGGYLIAGSGPLAVGWVFGLTGSWTVPFTVVGALAAVLFFAGLYVTRERFIEDELHPA